MKWFDAEGPPQFDLSAVLDTKKNIDDPPGEGPILRWQTRAVFAPGGDAWHPKNRKIKNVCHCERAWTFETSILSAERTGCEKLSTR